MSRVNHSCGPKCEVVWNAEYRSLDIRLRKLIRRSLTSRRAVLAVEEGEEVTVNCLAVSDGLSRSVRQRSLQKIYGWETGDYQLVINAIWRFSCTCSTCLLLGEHLRQEEDVRSELMRQHHLLQVRNRCWGKEGNRWSNSGGGGASWNTEKDQGDAQASQVRGNSAQYSLHNKWGKNKILLFDDISSACRGVSLQYTLRLVEGAVEAAQGSGAQNEDQVKPLHCCMNKRWQLWLELCSWAKLLLICRHERAWLCIQWAKLTALLAWQTQVVAAYKKRGLKLAIILYGKESVQARSWSEEEKSEEWHLVAGFESPHSHSLLAPLPLPGRQWFELNRCKRLLCVLV